MKMTIFWIFSILEIDSVHGSTIFVLDLSVASCDSHKSVVTFLFAQLLLGFGDVLFQFFEECNGPWLLIGNLVDNLLFCNLSHFSVQVEGRLSNWDNVFDDVPENTFITWGGSQRALVSPSLVGVDLLYEFG